MISLKSVNINGVTMFEDKFCDDAKMKKTKQFKDNNENRMKTPNTCCATKTSRKLSNQIEKALFIIYARFPQNESDAGDFPDEMSSIGLIENSPKQHPYRFTNRNNDNHRQQQ